MSLASQAAFIRGVMICAQVAATLADVQALTVERDGLSSERDALAAQSGALQAHAAEQAQRAERAAEQLAALTAEAEALRKQVCCFCIVRLLRRILTTGVGNAMKISLRPGC